MRRSLITAVGIVFFLGRLPGQSSTDGAKLFEQKKFADARTYFEDAIKRNAKDAEAYYYLALIHLRRDFRDLAKAQDYIEEAIDINDRVSKYHLARGQILGLKAQSSNIFTAGFIAPKVKGEFLRAVELDSTSIEARTGLFNYYLLAPGIMGGSEQEAFIQANEVSKLDPGQGHLLLASYYRYKKDFTKEEAEFHKLIQSDPKKSTGYKWLGYCLIRQKKFTDAVPQLKKFVELDPSNPDSHASLADGLAALERYDDAIGEYTTSLSLDRNFSRSVYGMAECYEKKGLRRRRRRRINGFCRSKRRAPELMQRRRKLRNSNSPERPI